MTRLAILLAGLAGLGGCGSVDIGRHAGEQPTLELSRYFDGTIDAWGLFQDRSGAVVKRFRVTIEGRWSNGHGVLDERFIYSDGSRQQRVWRIDALGDGRYRGRADDVVGVAVGESAGNALRWRYVLRLPVDEREYNISFDDWMYLIDERVLINRSVMRKFGIRLGEVTLTMRRRD
ncbi:MAG: DUF3833 domain-containing protein [Zoogloeaceae bacterium]|nr:DUF3833 domain-containing protein [Rhodocyclaceae bacterium]MCP5235199.1 DUF3833 domain-containing protein [Zoogloeaceae bacterium]